MIDESYLSRIIWQAVFLHPGLLQSLLTREVIPIILLISLPHRPHLGPACSLPMQKEGIIYCLLGRWQILYVVTPST
jgi:hypothetical protein